MSYLYKDNFLNWDHRDAVRNNFESDNFPWYFNSDVVEVKPDYLNNFQFTHTFVRQGIVYQICLMYFNLLLMQ